MDARASGTKRVVGWRRPDVCSLQRARHLPQMRSSITSRDAPSSSFVHGLELECFGRNSVTLHHIALVFRYRVLGTTPPRGGPVPAGENGSLLGKQSVVVLSEVTVIGTAPSHDGAVILDGSSVQCWVSTLSRRLRLNMSSLAVVCATTVTNYLDFARNCPARPCPICCRLSKCCFHRLMLARERRRSPRHFECAHTRRGDHVGGQLPQSLAQTR